MTKPTGATLFTGGGGADIGMKMAGIVPLWGIEYDNEIAEVARGNGIPVTTADILNADPAEFPSVNVLHASPPCQSFSVAKAGGEELRRDRLMAEKVVEFIRVVSPTYFTLENVYGYRKSESWRIICEALLELGYAVRYDHVNFANFGVPQTRKRMIVRAVRGVDRLSTMRKTHEKEPLPFAGLPRWVGWYEAIEDLIPTFEASEFAEWQLKRMPQEIQGEFLAEGRAAGFRELQTRGVDSPCMTVTTSGGGNVLRAFVVDSTHTTRKSTVRCTNQPCFTVTAGAMRRPSSSPRAFIADAANAGSNGKKKWRYENEPCKTMTASDSANTRAYLVNGTPNDHGTSVTVLDEAMPAYTQTASQYKRPARASVGGRVVKLSTRALARLQSFPDWYELPSKNSLACRIIGNAVPPVGIAEIYRQLLGVTP